MSNKWLIGVSLFVIGIVLAGGVIFIQQTVLEPNPIPLVASTDRPLASPVVIQQPNALLQPQNSASQFTEKLRSCVPFNTTFTHPLTGTLMEKKIVGLIEGKCRYVEQMPNNGTMTCNYTESERIAIAHYQEALASAETQETNISLTNNTQTKTYTINGKTVTNPLDEVLQSGTCVISGY